MLLEFQGDALIEADEQGKTLLEYSLANDIPHIHECYGSARCSTCRVRIVSGGENLSERNEVELRIAKMKGWPDYIRLACQARHTGDVVLKRLVLDDEDIRLAWSEVSRYRSGVEKEIVVLFLDVEKFTSFTEKNLPYDVIHIMNRFFNRLGDAVQDNNGYIDKFIGDSIMALFGLEGDDVREACLDALSCAISMRNELDSFNIYLRDNFDHEFSIRIGISLGPVILGNLGHRDRAQYTALGPAVNTASRLEKANKAIGTSTLISSRVYEIAGDAIHVGRKARVQLRGQAEPQVVYELVDVAGELQKKIATQSEPGREVTTRPAGVFVADLPTRLPAWETDNDHTEIGFEVDYLTTSVRGVFRVYVVDIRYDEDRPERTALSAIVKTSSIDTFVAARDNHLRSADFFDSDNYPNMTFTSTAAEVVSDNEMKLKGNLTIRDTTREVEFVVTVCRPLADAWGVYKRGFVGVATVDRYDFGIPFNLPLPAGPNAIGREVRIRLVLQIHRAAATTDAT